MRDAGTPCRKLGRLARTLLLRSRNGVAVLGWPPQHVNIQRRAFGIRKRSDVSLESRRVKFTRVCVLPRSYKYGAVKAETKTTRFVSQHIHRKTTGPSPARTLPPGVWPWSGVVCADLHAIDM